ncbi:PPC domain-containing protein [Synechococcus sp. PCC 7336]|uniref:PPC domain-containing protein n=1 Tax=Synechococcus sp. PCC 7336 TaxID=195250 RepID=UPI00035E8CD0|nr:PPC domain-containing protein [Synechococcus sp. PCC 7336]
MFVCPSYSRQFGMLSLVLGLSALCSVPSALAQQEEIQQLEEFLAPAPEPAAPAAQPNRFVAPAPRPLTTSPSQLPPPIATPVVLTPNSHRPGILGNPNQLNDGFYQDTYQFSGDAGEFVMLNLIGSSDRRMQLDPYLKLIGPDGEIVAEDDNSGFDPVRGDARILLPLPETGTYTVVVTSATPQDRGRYAIAVLEVEDPSKVP